MPPADDDDFDVDPNFDYAYRDALPAGPAHRRGAGINPGNRFEHTRLHILGEELDRQRIERQEQSGDHRAADDPAGDPRSGRSIALRQVFEDKSRTIINRVAQTADVPFDWTLNPYRGCEHGCIYCFARPYHEFLGFSSGLDFETKLMAKRDAPALLLKELAAPGWRAEPIVMSAITDIYQPIEHQMRIARDCLQIMADCGQPVTTMTKSALVLRDTDLWANLAAKKAGRVTVTLVTLDHDLAQKLEPRASSPAARLRIIRELTKAGIPVSVNIAPVIPGLTDNEVPEILKAVADAGANRVFWVMLRLPYQLKEIFLDWLQRNVHPNRAAKVESLIRQARGGKLYDASYATRRRGTGPRIDALRNTFQVFTKRYGLDNDLGRLSNATFKPPTPRGGQFNLFP